MNGTLINTTKWMTALALCAAAIACAKKRDAALSPSEATTMFAKEEIGDVRTAGHSIRLGAEKKILSAGEKALAINEKDLYPVDTENSRLPSRLVPLFKGLDVAGEPGQDYKVVFAVDNEFVTAYRAVNGADGLSLIEKSLATVADQIDAEIDLQRTSKSGESLKRFAAARDLRWNVIAEKTRQGEILVPLFKIKHDGVGILVPEKNKLGEETTNLILEKKSVAFFTHVKLTADASKRITPLAPADDAAVAKDLFLTARLNGLKLAAGELAKNFGIDAKRPADEPVAVSFTADELVVTELRERKPVFSMPVAHVTLVRPDTLSPVRVTHLELREGPVDLTETGLVKLIRVQKESKKDDKTGAAQ